MNLKKLLSVLLCMAMLLSMAAGLAGCGDDTAEENGAEEAVLGDVVKHSISVKSIGGMALDAVNYGLDVLAGNLEAKGVLTYDVKFK